MIDTRALASDRLRRGGARDGVTESLEEKLQAAGSAVEMARNSQIGPYVYPAVPRRVLELAGRAGRVAGDAARSSTSRTT